MNKSLFSKRTAQLIFQNRTLRTLFLLIALFLVMSLVLLFTGMSYSKKIEVNQIQIQDAETQLIQLQEIVTGTDDPATEKVNGRSFAPYDEIVPFIGLLESLFAIIDPESKINVKNEEKEIFVNRYADYEVQLKPAGKMSLFLRALDELHKAKYLTKIVSFNMNYTPEAQGKVNELQDVNLTIRLYFE